MHAQEFAADRVYGRLEEFLGVHFTQTFEPLDGKPATAHFFDGREDFGDGEKRFYLLLPPLALDDLEERLVLGRVVLDTEALLRQFRQQGGDGFAFVEFDLAGGGGGGLSGASAHWRV